MAKTKRNQIWIFSSRLNSTIIFFLNWPAYMDKRPVSGISPQNVYAENYYQYKKWFFALKTFVFFVFCKKLNKRLAKFQHKMLQKNIQKQNYYKYKGPFSTGFFWEDCETWRSKSFTDFFLNYHKFCILLLILRIVTNFWHPLRMPNSYSCQDKSGVIYHEKFYSPPFQKKKLGFWGGVTLWPRGFNFCREKMILRQ